LKNKNYFKGLNDFIWFIGIVESRFDPLLIGRIKIRIVGFHNNNTTEMPTEDLIWAYPIFPYGNNPFFSVPKEQDQVFGFFADGKLAQEPMIFGTIPYFNTSETGGFSEDNKEDIDTRPKIPKKIELKDDGSGTTIEEEDEGKEYPNKDYDNEQLTSRLIRNENIDKTLIQQKKDWIDIGQKDIPTSKHTTTGLGEDKNVDEEKFTEPETKYDTQYPYNNVLETESGHIFELDDTVGKERIHIAHRTGTFKEIFPDGMEVNKIVNDYYFVGMKNVFDHVENNKWETIDAGYKLYVNKDNKTDNDFVIRCGKSGNVKLTLEEGHLCIYVNGEKNEKIEKDCNIDIKGEKNLTIEKDYNITVEDDKNEEISGDWNVNVEGDININADGDINLEAAGDVNIKGSKISLN